MFNLKDFLIENQLTEASRTTMTDKMAEQDAIRKVDEAIVKLEDAMAYFQGTIKAKNNSLVSSPENSIKTVSKIIKQLQKLLIRD